MPLYLREQIIEITSNSSFVLTNRVVLLIGVGCGSKNKTDKNETKLTEPTENSLMSPHIQSTERKTKTTLKTNAHGFATPVKSASDRWKKARTRQNTEKPE